MKDSQSLDAQSTPKKREWATPMVSHRTTLEQVKGGILVNATQTEDAIYAPS